MRVGLCAGRKWGCALEPKDFESVSFGVSLVGCGRRAYWMASFRCPFGARRKEIRLPRVTRRSGPRRFTRGYMLVPLRGREAERTSERATSAEHRSRRGRDWWRVGLDVKSNCARAHAAAGENTQFLPERGGNRGSLVSVGGGADQYTLEANRLMIGERLRGRNCAAGSQGITSHAKAFSF